MFSVRRVLFAFLLIFALNSFCAGEPVKFARYPNVCGNKIAFTYSYDIWVANADGSEPYRLTNHIAKDLYPRFSPDGKWIAFCSDRMGNYDIYLMPIEGGEAKQLTSFSGNDIMVGWVPDGKRIIFRSDRNGTWGSPLYTVGIDGDLPIPLNIDSGYSGAISHDGSTLAFNRRSARYGRKHYKGNGSSDIWVQDLRTQKISQLTDTNLRAFRKHRYDLFPMWGADGMIYFASERDETFNIWKMMPDGSEVEQVTRHNKDGVHYPSISPDGKTIIYENEFDLWTIDTAGGEPERISIELGFEPKENLVEYQHVSSQADGFGPSPSGDYIAVDHHGEIFVVPTDARVGEKKQVTNSAYRDRHMSYSPDGKYICYISDESGDEELWLYEVEDGTKRKLTEHESLKRQYLWSKDSKQIAWTGANSLFLTEIESGEMEELAHNDARGFRLTDFSKDGEWIVYMKYTDDYNQDIYLFNIEEEKEYNITDNPFYDYHGTFSSDEKSVVFSSKRNNGTSHLFVLPLEKVMEDKDDPLVKEKKKGDKDKDKKKDDGEKEDEKKEDECEDNEDIDKKIDEEHVADPNEISTQKCSKEENGDEPKNEEEGEKKDEGIKFDMDGIERRAVQVSKKARDVDNVFVKDDKVYYTGRDDKGAGLFSIGIDGKDETKVTEGSFGRLEVTADKKMIFYKSGSSVYKMPLGSKKKEKVGFNIVVTIDKRKEWEQIFEECWRVMKYDFYDENMHGYDWDAIKVEYKPLLAYVSENQDLYDLVNLMIGELNASHTGVKGPVRGHPATYTTKLTGFDMVPDGSYFKVSHIFWEGPADKEWVDLNVGDYVLSIDGKDIRSGDNYWSILNHCLNDYVTFKVSSDPEGDDVRQIRIKTVTSLRDIKYKEWVEKNRKYVKELTDDKIAYVHIQRMDRSSLEKFKNEISRYHNHKGIVIDIRYNGGGNIDQELLDILSRRAYQYWNQRWSSREMGRRHRHAIIGPKVILINHGSQHQTARLRRWDSGILGWDAS
jgi:tricorn protease